VVAIPLDEELRISERIGQRVIGVLADLTVGAVAPLDIAVLMGPNYEAVGPDDPVQVRRETRHYMLTPESRTRLLAYLQQRITETFGWREEDDARVRVAQAHLRAENWRMLARRAAATLWLNRAEFPAGGYLEQAAPRLLADAATFDADPFLRDNLGHLEREIAEFRALHARVNRHAFLILEQIGNAHNALTHQRENVTWDERAQSATFHLAQARTLLLDPPSVAPEVYPGAIPPVPDPDKGRRAAYRRLDGVLREKVELARSILAHLRTSEARGASTALPGRGESRD
jgi:hypothetical protein